ncbi:endonuclease/exonuclease/phosphatase family protein [Actinomycetota bacterium]
MSDQALPQEGTMRVMSYNTRDFQDDVAAAVRVIRAVDPDVLCLQEVPRRLLSPFRVASFARRTGMYWSGRHTGSGGTTILTSLRVQVRESRHHRLRVARLQRTRGYAVIRVAPPGCQPVVVGSVHLSLDPREREHHAREILTTVSHGEPVILAGDLNEGESGRAWQLIASPLRLVSSPAPTYPSSHPRRLLDVIFASPELTVVRPGGPVDLDPADVAAGSDHRPVWVDVVAAPLTTADARREQRQEELSTQISEEQVAEAEVAAREAKPKA